MVMIGLEIHMQLITESKLFCPCSTNYQTTANTNICEICTAQPGSKPMQVNKRAVEQLLKLAVAMGSQVETSKGIPIQRKHYFYPDLPSNYQRTSKPLAKGGALGKVRITELHIEEDPGRFDIRTGLVEYNRSGVALVELVTEPDMSSPDEAREFLEQLATILDYLEVTKRDEGSMRIDANVSIEGGNRVEVKNINSFRGVFTALQYEIVRQKLMKEKGLTITQETRHFDESQGITLGSRKKETVDDYRYIPDPDLDYLVLEQGTVERISKTIPELPSQKAERLIREHGINESEAEVLVNDKVIADLFEGLVKDSIPPELAVKWLNRDLRKQLNYRGISFRESKLKEQEILRILTSLRDNKITDRIAEQMLIALLDVGKAPDLSKVSDSAEISKWIEEAIGENKDALDDYKKGNLKAMHFLFGKVMQKSQKQGDPEIIRKMLAEKLKGA